MPSFTCNFISVCLRIAAEYVTYLLISELLSFASTYALVAIVLLDMKNNHLFFLILHLNIIIVPVDFNFDIILSLFNVLTARQNCIVFYAFKYHVIRKDYVQRIQRNNVQSRQSLTICNISAKYTMTPKS